jgi:hypothetical protein
VFLGRCNEQLPGVLGVTARAIALRGVGLLLRRGISAAAEYVLERGDLEEYHSALTFGLECSDM